MKTYNRIYLFTSSVEQLEDTVPVLQARGYEVRSMVDAIGLLKYMKYPESARNIRWAMSQALMLGHFAVIHRDMEDEAAYRAVQHCRYLGFQCVHLDDLPLTPTCHTENIDAADLAGEEAPTTLRLREQLKKALGRVASDIMRAEHWLNSLLGDGLKNPMVREHHRAARAPHTTT